MNVQEQEYGTYKEVKTLFGIKRGLLYKLVFEGKVKSVSLRRPGEKRGVRLFYLPSVREFLESQLELQNK